MLGNLSVKEPQGTGFFFSVIGGFLLLQVALFEVNLNFIGTESFPLKDRIHFYPGFV